MKTVQIIGHAFDCLPGHVTIAARGSGANVRVATQRAVGNLLSDQRLHRKQISDFKISVVVIADRKLERESESSKHCDAGAMNDIRFGEGGE